MTQEITKLYIVTAKNLAYIADKLMFSQDLTQATWQTYTLKHKVGAGAQRMVFGYKCRKNRKTAYWTIEATISINPDKLPKVHVDTAQEADPTAGVFAEGK